MSDVVQTGSNATPAAVSSAGDERLAYRGPVQQLLTRPEIGAMLGLLGVWVLFWLVSVPFGTVGGTANFLDVAALLGVMSVPVALLMIGGEFDLSSGSMTGATAVFVILLSKEVGELGGAGLTLHIAVPLSLAFALAVGWANGTLVEKTSLPSFIVTLGTFFMLIGAKLAFSKLFTNKVIVEGLDEAEGYSFWDDIFGAEWVRNTHLWEGRDWAWAALLTLAGVALLLGMFELGYARRSDPHHVAAGVAIVGTAVGVFGFIMLLQTDGTASTWFWSAVVAVGTLGGVWAWCRARYEPAAPRSGQTSRDVVPLLIAGLVAIGLSVVFALVLDDTSSERLNFLNGAVGRFILAVGIGVTGVLAVLAAMGRVRTSYPVFGALIALVPTISYMMTVQGARSILFGGAAIVGLMALSAAGTRTHPSVWIPMLVALAVLGLAFFIQSESESRKLRVELFSVLLLLSLVMAASAIAGHLSQRRRSAPPQPQMQGWSRIAAAIGLAAAVVFAVIELVDGDGIIFALTSGVFKGVMVAFGVFAVGTLYRLVLSKDDCMGRPLIYVGLGAAGLGLAAKLLFVTSAELEATQAVTRFRVSVLFYLLFAVAGAWLLARTRFGSWTFAVGGNKDAARSVGVPTARTKTTLFMLVSGAAWVAGMLIAFRLNSVQANVGDGNEFRYIIIAVVGGNLLTGGYGSAIGAAIGASIWGMITQGIGFATWNTDWRFLVLGGLLVVAVIGNNFVRNRAEKSLPKARDHDPPDDPAPPVAVTAGDAGPGGSDPAGSDPADSDSGGPANA